MLGLEMKYFNLKPKGNNVYAYASRAAMLTYAEEIAEENRDLSMNLIKWVADEDRKAELSK